MVSHGHAVGIDLERVEERSADFEMIAFTDEERRLLPTEERDLWITRFWVAKEAVAKALGRGLEGNPQRFRVSDFTESRLIVEGHIVQIAVEGDFVVGWTRISAPDPIQKGMK